jgi:hypothetical protein
MFTRFAPSVTSASRPRHPPRLALDTRVLVLDAFIENPDRSSASNPNLLVASSALYAIDHGQALPAAQGITGKRLPYAFDSHLAWDVVRERPQLLDPEIDALDALPDEAIRDAVEAVPAAWWTDPARAEAVVRDLIARRGTLPDTLRQIQERLT